LAAGTTLDSYEEVKTVNPFGFDPIDEIIFKAALALDDRYIKIFGLLYKCHSEDQVTKRLCERGYNPLSSTSIQRYVSDSKKTIIELVIKNASTMNNVRKKLEEEYAGKIS
jgi:hypothetical protein